MLARDFVSYVRCFACSVSLGFTRAKDKRSWRGIWIDSCEVFFFGGLITVGGARIFVEPGRNAM